MQNNTKNQKRFSLRRVWFLTVIICLLMANIPIGTVHAENISELDGTSIPTKVDGGKSNFTPTPTDDSLTGDTTDVVDTGAASEEGNDKTGDESTDTESDKKEDADKADGEGDAAPPDEKDADKADDEDDATPDEADADETDGEGDAATPDEDAVEEVSTEDGGIRQHEMFEFEAFVKYHNILDGTEPFDANNEPGNDDSPNNNVVRSFDSISYPVKVTINPKKVDKLENIKLRLTGTLQNGITDKRVNAKFAIGGYEDMEKEEVSFTQEYTIKQTGNSVMIPVSVEVQGAKPGVELKPTIKVEVLSVDGKDIEKDAVSTVFDALPSVTVSAKVNVKALVGTGMTGAGIILLSYANITRNENDIQNTHSFSVAWGVERLAGKTDMRGATFPDPDGKINYTITLSGNVAWDGAPVKTGQEPLDFKGRDDPFLLLDHQPINNVRAKVGRENMVLDGKSYTYAYSNSYSGPRSQLSNYKAETIEQEKKFSVWDSGQWDLDAATIDSSTITYKGTNSGYTIGSTFPLYRSDGYTGAAIYGVNEKVFSSHSFLVLMPNQYRIGGPNNPDSYPNNVFYRAKVVVDSYTDSDGNTTTFNKAASIEYTERNNPDGSFGLNTSLISYPSGAVLGTPNIGDYNVSKGDASILPGQDVQMYGYLYPKMVCYGGHQAVYRWNTDAFELTKAYATVAKNNIMNGGYYDLLSNPIKNNTKTISVRFGVAKFPKSDNVFEKFTQKGKDDYRWYENYDDAVKKGPVGAILWDVQDVTAPRTQTLNRVPLRVKNENIKVGAETKDGSASITLINYYAYLDKERKQMVDVTKRQSYYNPAIWDNRGTLIKKQSPVGHSVNFETLAVVPAESASIITSDKTTYYNSETVHWSVDSSLKLPPSGIPDGFDPSVRIEQTLPQGLTYKPGSGQVGREKIEPEIEKTASGETKLRWELFVPRNGVIDAISFDTDINPFALSSGVQSGLTITNVIHSEFDQRPVNLRTTTKNITILKVGMVGIYETIDALNGGRNSDYTITLAPYTTIEDEKGVTGLTTLPTNKDELGSKFDGDVALKKIDIKAERKHEGPVKIYLNKHRIKDDKPQHIDVTENGWYEYTGDPSELEGAMSLLFRVDGLMTNKDDIKIHVTIQTSDNHFGDYYYNETVINSDTDYNLSPMSNRVKYMIRADLELGLERIRIYTDKADKGLPAMVRVKQTVLDAETIKDSPVRLAIYDSKSGDVVATKTYKQHELQRENELLIDTKELPNGDKRNYEARIEGIDEDLVWIVPNEGVIDTDGYTASKKVLTEDDRNDDGEIHYKGVVMTERELGKSIVLHYETFDIAKIKQPRVKSGYGYTFEPSVKYTNDLMDEIVNKIGIKTNTDADMSLDKRLVDDTIEYYDKDSERTMIPLDRQSEDTSATSYGRTYEFPHTYLSQEDGKIYSANQQANHLVQGATVDAGHKLYVPVWIETLGKFDAAFVSKQAVGSNQITFDVLNKVDVFAYMFSHTDSGTPDDDELLVHPMDQEKIPNSWTSEK